VRKIKHAGVVLGIHLVIAIARGIYSVLKLFPTRDKVVFLSRQSRVTPLDFQLLIDSLGQKAPEIETKVLCRTFAGRVSSLFRYFPHFLVQGYHLATSKVAVLDSYSMAVCILKHKKSLSVIQLWHGLGAFKKFGYAVLDVAEGQTGHTPLEARHMAQLMHQHENYDVVVTSSRHSVPFYAEAFNIDPAKIVVSSLPRADVLTDKQAMNETRSRLESAYPQLVGKKNIIFSPTFRRHDSIETQIRALADQVDYESYNLIIRLHPLTKTIVDDARTLKIDDFSTLEILSVCDYMVTDYSAVTFEMYLLGRPVFFFQFDAEAYERDRGFFTTPSQFPSQIYTEPAEVVRAIEAEEYDLEAIAQFINREIEHHQGNTDRLAGIILDLVSSS
jgi:CDP-ribitol ribitolphosphotransferase